MDDLDSDLSDSCENLGATRYCQQLAVTSLRARDFFFLDFRDSHSTEEIETTTPS